MAESSLPWGTSADDPGDVPAMYQDRWRALFGGALPDGVVNDVDGTGLAVTYNNTSSVTVTAGQAVVQGMHYVLTANLPINLDASAPAPTSGNRADWIVLRYDPAAQSIHAVVVAGTIGGGIPTLQRNKTGIWEFPLAQVDRTSTSAASSGFDARVWAPGLMYRRQGKPTAPVPIGTRVVNSDGGDFVRGLVSGSPAWVDLRGDTAWTEFDVASTLTKDAFHPLRFRTQGANLFQLDGVVSKLTGFFTEDLSVTVGASPINFYNLGDDNRPLGGRLFTVVLDAYDIDDAMLAPAIGIGRIKENGDLTVYIPAGVTGCNRIQFDVQLRLQ